MSNLVSINPSNYSALGEVEISTEEEIKEKVKLARKAQKPWASMGIKEKVKILKRVFDEFTKRREEIILLESQEMGMPINEAGEDFDWTLEYVKWDFENAEKYLGPETTYEDNKEIHRVFHEPIGVHVLITPWNFPFANFVWGGLQSLIAGNTIVFKHSEEVPLNGKLIEEVLSKYLPRGVFNEIYGDSKVGQLLLEQDINMVGFTGSTKVGKSIYETAGRRFIKALMELGGSAPAIIFEDANIEKAIGSVCDLRLLNAGQCCDGLKRLIIHESIFDQVVEKVASIFSSKKIGEASRKDTKIGPLVAKRQLQLLLSQVTDAKTKGAKIVTGGNSLEEKMGGAFFEPTVVTNIKPNMKVWTDEVFGPVLPIVKFKTEKEAIDLANGTIYGLGSYIYTEDKKRAERVSSLIESGMVSVNGTNYIVPPNPFGGYKNSGLGREHGKYGFSEVTQVKVVAMSK